MAVRSVVGLRLLKHVDRYSEFCCRRLSVCVSLCRVALCVGIDLAIRQYLTKESTKISKINFRV